jgi:hypothetical protein
MLKFALPLVFCAVSLHASTRATATYQYSLNGTFYQYSLTLTDTGTTDIDSF